jgi:HK97 family phage prohead protease
MSKENKIIKFLASEKADVNDSERSIVHYASTNDIDRDNEIILPEGIDLTNYQKNPQVLWNHMSWSSAITTIGKSLWQKVDGKGLLCKTEFAPTSLGNECFELYKGGFLTSWSIGFLAKEWSDSDNGIRTFTKTEMLEYSAVTIPANPEAISLNFIKGLKSDEMRDAFAGKYLLESVDKEINELKSLISKSESTPDIEAIVKAFMEKELADKFKSIASELKSVKADVSKMKIDSIASKVLG